MNSCRHVQGGIAAALIVSFLPGVGLGGTALAATPDTARPETPQRTVVPLDATGLTVDRIRARTLRDQIRELDSDSDRLLRLLDAQPRPVARTNAAAQTDAPPKNDRYKRLKAVAVIAGVAVAGVVLVKAIQEYRDIPK